MLSGNARVTGVMAGWRGAVAPVAATCVLAALVAVLNTSIYEAFPLMAFGFSFAGCRYARYFGYRVHLGILGEGAAVVAMPLAFFGAWASFFLGGGFTSQVALLSAGVVSAVSLAVWFDTPEDGAGEGAGGGAVLRTVPWTVPCVVAGALLSALAFVLVEMVESRIFALGRGFALGELPGGVCVCLVACFGALVLGLGPGAARGAADGAVGERRPVVAVARAVGLALVATCPVALAATLPTSAPLRVLSVAEFMVPAVACLVQRGWKRAGEAVRLAWRGQGHADDAACEVSFVCLVAARVALDLGMGMAQGDMLGAVASLAIAAVVLLVLVAMARMVGLAHTEDGARTRVAAGTASGSAVDALVGTDGRAAAGVAPGPEAGAPECADAREPLFACLSERERTVARGISAGKTLAAIAGEMGLSKGTVSTYARRVYEKLGVSGARELRGLLADGGAAAGEGAGCVDAWGAAGPATVAGECGAGIWSATTAAPLALDEDTARVAESLGAASRTAGEGEGGVGAARVQGGVGPVASEAARGPWAVAATESAVCARSASLIAAVLSSLRLGVDGALLLALGGAWLGGPVTLRGAVPAAYAILFALGCLVGVAWSPFREAMGLRRRKALEVVSLLLLVACGGFCVSSAPMLERYTYALVWFPTLAGLAAGARCALALEEVEAVAGVGAVAGGVLVAVLIYRVSAALPSTWFLGAAPVVVPGVLGIGLVLCGGRVSSCGSRAGEGEGGAGLSSGFSALRPRSAARDGAVCSDDEVGYALSVGAVAGLVCLGMGVGLWLGIWDGGDARWGLDGGVAPLWQVAGGLRTLGAEWICCLVAFPLVARRVGFTRRQVLTLAGLSAALGVAAVFGNGYPSRWGEGAVLAVAMLPSFALAAVGMVAHGVVTSGDEGRAFRALLMPTLVGVVVARALLVAGLAVFAPLFCPLILVGLLGISAARDEYMRRLAFRALDPEGRGRTVLADLGLSEAECEVAYYVSRGLTSREIAERRCVSPSTVVSQRRRIYRVLDVHSRAELAECLEREVRRRLMGRKLVM